MRNHFKEEEIINEYFFICHNLNMQNYRTYNL